MFLYEKMPSFLYKFSSVEFGVKVISHEGANVLIPHVCCFFPRAGKDNLNCVEGSRKNPSPLDATRISHNLFKILSFSCISRYVKFGIAF
jgi:hypothetical protein